MPLPKRKRIFTPKRHKTKHNLILEQGDVQVNCVPVVENEVTVARGRLKGALMEALEPAADESDGSVEYTPVKKERRASYDQYSGSSAEEDKPKSPPRQSYVLKLFDRSVDLSQFNEDSPLYPICRAWIANRPKANYSDFGKRTEEPPSSEYSIELPGPEGPPVSRIPSLLPEQLATNKDNINLNYREAPPPSREQLLRGHLSRWAGVRGAWLARAALVEARYSDTQDVLNKINVSAS